MTSVLVLPGFFDEQHAGFDAVVELALLELGVDGRLELGLFVGAEEGGRLAANLEQGLLLGDRDENEQAVDGPP